jgi:hypothetical protein
MKMEVVYSSETSATLPTTTQRGNPIAESTSIKTTMKALKRETILSFYNVTAPYLV